MAMTGPEHYRRAEELVKAALNGDQIDHPRRAASEEDRARYLTAAQVHATLAQTAATLMKNTTRGELWEPWRDMLDPTSNGDKG
ncbi:hypothetical protein [Micromonospora sp. RP3T]|uniref:hypothetical protein n=1 Tax=Micromonospora sp. RP3T TaxID=2135446 RepID=UPI003D7134D7